MKTYNPTTPGRRAMTAVGYKGFSRGKSLKALFIRLKKRAGRNNQGRITVRHQGGGSKRFYRIIDFKQDKFNISGTVEGIEYDPYRTAFIARVRYADGDRRYILAPHGLKVRDTVVTGPEAPFSPGNRTILKRIPVGTFVYSIEFTPGSGGTLARSAGSGAQILAHEDGYTHVKLPSGEVRKVLWDGYASIGSPSSPENNLVRLGKAGRSRHLGIRPTVRGSAMNPRDHPYGGGEGRAKRGTRRPKTKWGKITGGRKTRRKKKWSNTLIIKRRK